MEAQWLSARDVNLEATPHVLELLARFPCGQTTSKLTLFPPSKSLILRAGVCLRRRRSPKPPNQLCQNFLLPALILNLKSKFYKPSPIQWIETYYTWTLETKCEIKMQPLGIKAPGIGASMSLVETYIRYRDWSKRRWKWNTHRRRWRGGDRSSVNPLLLFFTLRILFSFNLSSSSSIFSL